MCSHNIGISKYKEHTDLKYYTYANIQIIWQLMVQLI